MQVKDIEYLQCTACYSCETAVLSIAHLTVQVGKLRHRTLVYFLRITGSIVKTYQVTGLQIHALILRFAVSP